MKKRLIAIAMILTLCAVTFCGCGAGAPAAADTNSASAEPAAKTEEAKPAEAAQEEKTEEALEPIKIGLVAPFSGGAAEWGHYYEDATRLACEEINAAGGVLGHELTYIVEDDQSTAEGTTTACTHLMDAEKVDMLTGFSQSALSMVAKEITRDKIFHLVASSQSVAITDEGHKWLFALTPTVADHATGLNKFVLSKGKKIGLIVENSDYGVDNEKLFNEMKADYPDVEIVDTEWVTTTDTDFTLQLTKIKAAKPDFVYCMVTVPACYSQIFKQMKELGMDMNKAQCAGNLNPAAIEASAGGLEGVYTADLWDISVTKGNNPDQASKEFAEKWYDRYGYDAHKASTQLYHAIHVYAKAVEAAGTYTDYDKLAEVMHSMEFDSLWKSPIKFDETGRNHSDVYILQIVDGATTLVDF